MQRVTLYSRSGRGRPAHPEEAAPAAAAESQPARAGRRVRARDFFHRHHRPVWLAGGAVLAALAVLVYATLSPQPRAITQDDPLLPDG